MLDRLKVLCGDLVVEFVSTAFSTKEPLVLSRRHLGVSGKELVLILQHAGNLRVRGGRDVDEHVGESGRSLP
jgi:hypothetical protein